MSNDRGKRLSELRKLHGWSQSQLSKLADVSNDHISKIELGKADNIGLNTIESLASALGVDPCFLAYGVMQSPEIIEKFKQLVAEAGKLNSYNKRIISILDKIPGEKQRSGLEIIVKAFLKTIEK